MIVCHSFADYVLHVKEPASNNVPLGNQCHRAHITVTSVISSLRTQASIFEQLNL